MCEIKDMVALGCLLICAVSDLRTRKIPTGLLVGMSVAAALFCLLLSGESPASILGGLAMGVVFWMISKVTKEAIGYGDSWVILLLGGYLGLFRAAEVIMAAFFCVGLCSLAGITLKKWKKTVTIPFVPFLTAAYIGVVMI